MPSIRPPCWLQILTYLSSRPPFPQVLDQLKGKSVDEVIAEGLEKLASVPSGGGGGGGGGGAAPAAAGGAPAAAAAAPKEEEKKEASEEEGMDFGLFD